MKKVLKILTIILLSSIAFSSCQKTNDKWPETPATENTVTDLKILDFRYDQIPAKGGKSDAYLVFEYNVNKKYPDGTVKTDYVKEFSAQPPAYGAAYRAVYTFTTDYLGCNLSQTGSVSLEANGTGKDITFDVKVNIVIGDAKLTGSTTVTQKGS